jgi:hypothetical protein
MFTVLLCAALLYCIYLASMASITVN